MMTPSWHLVEEYMTTNYLCPNCGQTALEIHHGKNDYGFLRKLGYHFAKCCFCKWKTQSYRQLAKLLLEISYTLPRFFIFDADTNTITGYVSDGGGGRYAWTPTEISIPRLYNGAEVRFINAGAFSETSIKSVILPSSVITIGENAFTNTPLSSVTFGSKIYEIGNNAFNSLFLTELEIPGSIGYIGEGAFSNNLLLTKITITDMVVEDPGADHPTINLNTFANCPLDNIIIGADFVISASVGTMGTNGDFKADYEAGGSLAGNYAFFEGTWYKK
jgi:ssDNA-binding Zn-finger/Zn-ribbon topoisomerase 1